MSFNSVIQKITPWLATAAGIAVPGAAPLINMAASALSKGLGTTIKAEPQAISDAITQFMATPEQVATLKKIDDDFALQMRALGIQEITDLEKINADDRADARAMQMQTKSWIPGFLAVSVTLGFFGLLALMAFHALPTANEKVFDIMLGSLGAAWIAVVNYYLGSSAGSAQKTDLLAAAPPIQK